MSPSSALSSLLPLLEFAGLVISACHVLSEAVGLVATGCRGSVIFGTSRVSPAIEEDEETEGDVDGDVWPIDGPLAASIMLREDTLGSDLAITV